MRIIAGKLKGRRFEAPRGQRTHPMSEKMRGAIFSALGDIEGLILLDAFAGSGAISFEALSRGAAKATAIEVDVNTYNIIDKNAKNLQFTDSLKTIRANVSSWSDNNKNKQFDIVFCDPPYDKLQISLLQKMAKHLADNGVLVLSWPGKVEIPEFVGLKILKSKNYGDSSMIFYKRAIQ